METRVATSDPLPPSRARGGRARARSGVSHRIALGAQRAEIVGLVLGQGMSLAAIGSAIGLTLAAAAGRALSGFLFGLPAIDPAAFAGTAALFAAVGLAACYVPARRATRVDPLAALRCE